MRKTLVVNISLALLWAWFAYVNAKAFLVTKSPSILLLVIVECILVGLFLFRQKSQATSTRVSDWVIAVLASAIPLLYRPDIFIDSSLSTVISIIGAGLLIVAYLFLGRSVAIVPALRTVKTSGLYAYVRHPVYTAYLFIYVGYVLANATIFNSVILLAILILMHLRIDREEKFLSQNSQAYVEYAQNVRWKLIPFIY